jgi:hypothetical protein
MRAGAFFVLMFLCVLIAGCSTTVYGSQLEISVPTLPAGTFQGLPGSGFGAALAVDGSIVVVGAFLEGPSRAGAAYVYRYANGEWTQDTRFQSPTPVHDGFFGSSVAVRGGVIAIAARNEGAIYVYRNAAGGWLLTDRLQPGDTFASNRFGAGLALDSEWLAFNGEVRDQRTGEHGEAVYMYSLTEGPLALSHVIRSGQDDSGSFFGGSIALADDTIAIGASGKGPTSRSSGAVYVYDLSMGNPRLIDELTAPPGIVAHAFGASLALSENLLAVASPGEDYGGYRSGPVVLFERTGGSWDATATLVLDTLSGDDRFGTDLALLGDDLLIAGYTDNDLSSGSTYTAHFTRTAGRWAEVAVRITPSSTPARFTKLASDGATLLVSAPSAEYSSTVESFHLTRSSP